MARAMLLLLLACVLTFAQDTPTVNFVPVAVEDDAPPVQTPRFKHLLLVVDMSWSVQGRPEVVQQTLHGAQALSQAGGDDWAIKVIAFAERPQAWSKGWLDMPDDNAPRLIESFLKECTAQKIGNGTLLHPALELALREPKADMLVAVLSDGLFHSWVEHAQMLALQQRRRVSDLGPAPIAFLITTDPIPPLARTLAKSGGGGLFAQR